MRAFVSDVIRTSLAIFEIHLNIRLPMPALEGIGISIGVWLVVLIKPLLILEPDVHTIILAWVSLGLSSGHNISILRMEVLLSLPLEAAHCF